MASHGFPVTTAVLEAPHFQYHVSGVLRIRMEDGSEFDCRPAIYLSSPQATTPG